MNDNSFESSFNDDNNYASLPCIKCGNIPCALNNDLKEYLDELFEELEQDEHVLFPVYGTNDHVKWIDLPNKGKRYYLYKKVVRYLYGSTGKNIRVPLGNCVESHIRDRYPSEGEDYTGFLDTGATKCNEEGNSDSSDDESFD